MARFDVVVSGSRSVTDFQFVCKVLDKYKDIIGKVIVGDAVGVDAHAVEWCKMNKVPFEVFEAKWNDLEAPGAVVKFLKGLRFNANAGMDRNAEMMKLGKALIAIWDGSSKGTANQIKLCQAQDKVCLVERYYHYT